MEISELEGLARFFQDMRDPRGATIRDMVNEYCYRLGICTDEAQLAAVVRQDPLVAALNAQDEPKVEVTDADIARLEGAVNRAIQAWQQRGGR
ncbi:hypothetical protein JW766_02910 [Candidatus Dojkabacteria bacterium]|nr:hypothetical protein [Candidatus Dojkabacteria bacterium]